MAVSTEYYSLTKPAGTDLVDVDDLNGNFDKIDQAMKSNADAIVGIREDFVNKDDIQNEIVEDSEAPVSSGAVFSAFADVQERLSFDTEPTEGSSKPVTSDGLYAAFEEIQSRLEFDTEPTEGSGNPVTSGGIFTALQTAGAVPDWDQSDKTAADYIKNRPFYRELISSESVVNAYAMSRTGYGGDWVHFEGAKISGTVPEPGQECTVTITYNSVTISEKIKVVKGTWNSTWHELLIYGEAVRMKVNGSWIYPSASITAFGGMSGSASYSVQVNTYEYTMLPEEYLDTSFAAPAFLNEKYVTWQSLKAEDAFILMRKDGAYYQQRLSIMVGHGLDELGFTERLEELEGSVGSQTDVLSAISDLQDKTASLESGNQEQAGQISDLQDRTTSLESENQEQAGQISDLQEQLDLIASLQAQIQSLTSRVAYLESLHTDTDVVITEADNVLSINGTGASVEDGELILTTGNVSVVDGVLVYGTDTSGTATLDDDGILTLTGSSVSVVDGELVINSESTSVTDGELVYGSTAEDISTDEDGTLSLTGEGIGVSDGELVINSESTSVTDGELVYGSTVDENMSTDEDGSLDLTGDGISVSDSELTIDSDSISVVDGSLTTGTDVSDGVVTVNSASVDESGVCDLGDSATVNDGTISI